MEKLTKKEIEEILSNEKELFNGNRRAACAAHLYSPVVVMKTGYKEPLFADKKAVSEIKAQVTQYVNEQNKN